MLTDRERLLQNLAWEAGWDAAMAYQRITGEMYAERCHLRWDATGGATSHEHACRHEQGHPGRHVCRCRSWVSRQPLMVVPGASGEEPLAEWEAELLRRTEAES